MNFRHDDTTTDLYLVRIWRRYSGDGAPGLRGKLQHVVSGATTYFEELPELPKALESLMEQDLGSIELGMESEPGEGFNS